MDHAVLLDRLSDMLRTSQKPSLDVLSKIIAGACTRIPILSKTEPDCIIRLAEAGAWTDAALALISLELPLWNVRRLAYENGEWLCSLTRQPNPPVTLDDCTEATHEALPLAILSAFLDACRRDRRFGSFAVPVPQIQQRTEGRITLREFPSERGDLAQSQVSHVSLWSAVILAAGTGKAFIGSSDAFLAISMQRTPVARFLPWSPCHDPRSNRTGGSLVVLPTVAGFLFALYLEWP